MPIVGLVTPHGDWRAWEIWVFKIGPLLGAVVDFLIVAWVVFWFAKKVLREETVAKK